MKKYTVQDENTGRTITFEWSGDEPPTDADFAEVFESAGAPTAEDTPEEVFAPAKELTFGEKATSVLGDVVGIGTTAADYWLDKVPGDSEAIQDVRRKIAEFDKSRRQSLSDLRGSSDMGRTEQFATAVGGGMYGAGLGAQQTAAELFSREPERIEELRQAEKDRRSTMSLLKAERGGEPGFNNLATWGELVGETLPYTVPATRAATPLRAVAAGLGGGTAVGGSAPLVEGESRLGSAGLGGAAGAVLGPAGYGLTKAVQSPPVLADLIRRYGIKKADELKTPAAEKVRGEAEKAIRKGLTKVAPPAPGKLKGSGARPRLDKQRVEAVKDIVRLSDEIELPDPITGAPVKGRTPKTQEELLLAIDQAKDRVMQWTNRNVQEATGGGLKIPVDDIVSELEKVTTKGGFRDSQVQVANKLRAQLEEIQEDGGFAPEAALRFMKTLNNDIKDIFTGKNVSGDSPEVLGIAANRMRSSINDTMEKLPGSEFSDLRKSWGRLSGLSEDVLRNLEKRTYGGGGMSVFDILGTQQMGQAVSRQRPEKFLEGIGTLGIGQGAKWLRNTDRQVKNIFDAAKRDVGRQRLKEPTLGAAPPAPDPVTPAPSSPAPAATPKKRSQSISADKFAEQFGISVEEAARILEEGTKGVPKMAAGGLVGLAGKYKVQSIKPGAMYKGWQFLGGKPSDPSNWRKP